MPALRTYPLRLREHAVQMYRAAEPKPVICRMAEELGVHHETLRGWIRQAEAGTAERTICSPPRRRKSLPRCGAR